MQATPPQVPANTVGERNEAKPLAQALPRSYARRLGKYAPAKHSRWERLTLALAVNKLAAS